MGGPDSGRRRLVVTERILVACGSTSPGETTFRALHRTLLQVRQMIQLLNAGSPSSAGRRPLSSKCISGSVQHGFLQAAIISGRLRYCEGPHLNVRVVVVGIILQVPAFCLHRVRQVLERCADGVAGLESTESLACPAPHGVAEVLFDSAVHHPPRMFRGGYDP